MMNEQHKIVIILKYKAANNKKKNSCWMKILIDKKIYKKEVDTNEVEWRKFISILAMTKTYNKKNNDDV